MLTMVLMILSENIRGVEIRGHTILQIKPVSNTKKTWVDTYLVVFIKGIHFDISKKTSRQSTKFSHG